MKILRIVPDTNVMIQGLLSHTNNERKLINLALSGKVALYGSASTFDEFCRKLHEVPKLKKYMAFNRISPESMIMTYRSIVTLVDPQNIFKGESITRDPDDDIFFRVAAYKNSQIIVTNDKDLHDTSPYEGIRAVKPEKFISSYIKWNDGKLLG